MIPKLRVWDTVKKAMHDVQAIVYTEERVYPIYSKLIRKYIPFGEAILMQFTGLKDKNGVEIFEGDVVRFGHVFEGFLNQVVWDKQSCAFKLKSLDNRWDDTYFSNFGEETIENLEVIGNIYELESVEE